MPSSIRRAFRHRTNTVIDEISPATASPTTTKSFFKTSLRGRTSSDKTDKAGATTDPSSPSKTKREIKTSDIVYISSEDTTKFSPQPDLEDSEDCDGDGRLSRPDSPLQVFVIDKTLVDQFPLPPVVHAYTSPDVRIPVPSSGLESGSSNLSSDELLPPLHPRVQQYIAEQKTLERSIRRQPLTRSSSVTSYSRPTATAYSALFQDNGPSISPGNRSVLTHRERPDHSQSLSCNRSTPHSVGNARPLLHQRSYSDMGCARPEHQIM